MATKSHLKRRDIGSNNPHLFNPIRTTIETAFYKNNVISVNSLEEAYQLARHSPGTIESDLPIYRSEDLGLPREAKVLLFNDGGITGRQASARRIIDQNNIHAYSKTLRESIYHNRDVTMYHATVMIGLHEDFALKAHLLIPEGFENTLYSWMLNFQMMDEAWLPVYEESRTFDEGDIFLYSDPDHYVSGHENGLALFDRDHNAAALFGLRYFGEHKKASLTMAWTLAKRQNFTACHGGIKKIKRGNQPPYIMSVFGLSGSGKSTLTHAKHNGKYNVEVLHDDAFVIENHERYSISLEPSYFDKVADYPTDSEDNRFLLTVQNVGATKDEDGLIVPVTEDIRNGNGRAVKSKFWTPSRAYKFSEPINAIFWIMKDDTLPPIMKIHDAALASTMGAVLATKRSSAEEGADPNALTFVPYANPFRLYPLTDDYENFKRLFTDNKVNCYILNTGSFQNKNITPEITLSAIENIIEGNDDFKPFFGSKELLYAPIEGYDIDPKDKAHIEAFNARIQKRIDFIDALKGEDVLPSEAKETLTALKRESGERE